MITSADMKKWTAAIARRLRAIVAGGRLPTPHPPFHGLQAPCAVSVGGRNQRQNNADASADSMKATQPWLPIGPSCC